MVMAKMTVGLADEAGPAILRLRWFSSDPPSRANHVDGVGRGRHAVAGGRLPADRTTKPRRSSSSIGTAQPRASSTLQIASAMGLRQVLPVQTNRMIRLAVSARVAASITPCAFDAPALLVDLDHRGELPVLRRPGVDHHVDAGQPAQGIGRRGDRMLGRRHHRDDQGRRQEPQHVADDRLSGLRRATSPFGEISDLTSLGRRLYRPSAMLREKTRVAGPGQSRQAIRRPTCEIRGTQSVTSSGPFKSKVRGRARSDLRSARTRATPPDVNAQAAKA